MLTAQFHQELCIRYLHESPQQINTTEILEGQLALHFVIEHYKVFRSFKT
jgi:hypothetical protein